MEQVRVSPLGALARGFAAGVVGTAAMTAYQEVSSRLRNSGEAKDGKGDGGASWDEAPAPAQLARRILEGIFQRDVPPEKIPLLTNAMHWGYGTAWGGIYGLIAASVRANPVALGSAFGAGVWAMSYVELVPMGLYEPPWEYPAKEIARDLSYHLVYGLGVAAGYGVLERVPG